MKSTPQHLATIVVLTIIVGAAGLSNSTYGAGSRGISVNLRASESLDAPISERITLYEASYALVIGNDAYNNGWPPLTNAIKDAELIAEALEEKGFEVELHKNLDSSRMRQVFIEFFVLKGDNRAARLFVWFAGHGATVDGEGYLIPVDAPAPSNRSRFKLTSLALRDFGTFMRQALAKHVYAIFDSCFAGTVFQSQRAIPPAAITLATTLPVRQFLTSGDEDQTVSDDGTFRELFIRAIRGEERSDANGDGYVTASELGMFLGDRITNLTQSAQTPRYGKLRDKDFDRGDFVFVLPEDAMGKLQVLQAGGESAEIMFWNSIRNSESGKQFDAYLKQYPYGAFVPLAMIRKGELGKKVSIASRKVAPREKFKVTFLDQDLVAAREANVRQNPFLTANKVGKLEKGALVWAIGETSTQGRKWYKVARDGLELGFVAASLLSATGRRDDFIEVESLPIPSVADIEQSLATEAEEDAFLRDDPEIIESPDQADDLLSYLLEGLLAERMDSTPPEQTAAVTPSQVRTAVAQVDKEVNLAMPNLASGTTMQYQAPPPAITANPPAPAEMPTLTDSSSAFANTLPPTISPAAVIETAQATQDQLLLTSTGTTARQQEFLRDDSNYPNKINKLQDILNQNTQDSPEDIGKLISLPRIQQQVDRLPAGTEAMISESISIVSEPHVTSSQQASTVRQSNVATAAEASSAVEKSADPADDQQQAQAIFQPATQATDQTATRIALLQSEQNVQKTATANDDYIRRYIAVAESGNVRAQASLAYMYQTGDKVNVDKVEAARWYRRAAVQGDLTAQLNLGLMYEKGNGIPVDFTEAALWYRNAAQQGDADAQQRLAYMYEHGRGVVKDETEAARWYERAAGQGRVAAQNNLGRLYQLGIGVSQDVGKAIYWYELAAAQGSDAARNNLRGLKPR